MPGESPSPAEPSSRSPTVDSSDDSEAVREQRPSSGLASKTPTNRVTPNVIVSPQIMRLAGSGMELASYTLLLGAGGYWLDSRFANEKPWLAVFGALLGFTLGMYRLIRLALRAGNSNSNR